MEEQRRSSSSPQANHNSDKSTLRDPTALALAGLVNVVCVAVVYLCFAPLVAIAKPMKAALRLLLALARGTTQASQWLSRKSSTSTVGSTVLSASSVLVLRIVRAFLAFTQLILRKPALQNKQLDRTEKLEEKIDTLAQQLHNYRTRLESVEQLSVAPRSSLEDNVSPLPAFQQLQDLRRRSSVADRRRSYPEEYFASLKRMLAEARTDKRQSVYDSPDTDSSTSSCSDQSMPPTPTLIPSRRVSSTRQEKRRSTGLKPLLLPSILAYESQNSPPARCMYRMSWHREERPLVCDDSLSPSSLPIAEEEEVSRCETPSRPNEDLDMEAAQFATAEPAVCLENPGSTGGLNFVMADSWLNLMTLPTIPSKRSLSSVEA